MRRNQRRRKRGGLLWRLLAFCVLVGVLVFGGTLGYLCWAEATVPVAGETDAIIVLGCQVLPDGTPSVQLEWRLDTAYNAYQAQNRLMVVCGAQGADEPAPEAEIMRDWLTARGVPTERILLDTNSFNTQQNLENAKALLPEGMTRVLIVTSDYHLPRCMQIARDLGLSPSGVGAPCKPEYWVKNHFRETLAWGKYWLTQITGK